MCVCVYVSVCVCVCVCVSVGVCANKMEHGTFHNSSQASVTMAPVIPTINTHPFKCSVLNYVRCPEG